MTAFKDRLRELRKSKKLTQEKLADELHVKKSTISMYENGNREPDHEMTEQIADYFNVDIDYLMGRSDMTTRIERFNILQDDDTKDLIKNIRRLSPQDQNYVSDLIKRLNGRK